MRRRLLTKPLLLLLAALVLSGAAAGTVAFSADPTEGTVSFDEPATWTGSVQGYANGNVCRPPVSSEVPACDEFELTVDVDAKYWAEHEGGAEIIVMPTDSLTANLNIAVYDKDGNRVATGSSTVPTDATEPTSERVIVSEANRGASPYSVIVYNNDTGAVAPPTTVEYDASARIDTRPSVPTGGGTSDRPIPTERVSDAPCVDGFSAGVFPCENVDLKSFLPISEIGGLTPGEIGDGTVDDALNDRLNDIWGWTDPEDGHEYAIVGKRDGTAFVDVTDPSNPKALGELPTFAGLESPVFNVWRDMKVYKNHAFIVSEEPAHGMQVFDLTQLRAVRDAPENDERKFTETVHYGEIGNTHNIAINEDTGFAYLIGTNTCSGGSHIVDIRTPTAPTFAGCVAEDGYTHDNQCVVYDGPDERFTGREICFDFNEDTLTIVDVTNKGADAERPILSKLPYEGSAYTHQGWLTPDQQHVLMNDELDEQGSGNNTTTRIVDVSRLTSPRLVDTYEHPAKAIDHNNYIKNSTAYQSNYRSGLRVLDVRGVADGDLRTAGYFDVFPADDEAEFNGTWSNYPYFESGNVIVTGIEQGLFVVRPRAAAGGADGTFPASGSDGGGSSSGSGGGSSSGGGRDTGAADPAPASPAPTTTAGAPSTSPPVCAASAGFRSVRVAQRGGGASLAFQRARDLPVTVDVFQQSVGRRVIGERLVARFTGRDASVAWNGRANRPGRTVRDGYLFARYRMGTGANADIRRVALRRVGGRFSTRPEFYRRASCDLLRRFKLERPVFGGRSTRALGISYQLERAGRVQVSVLRGTSVVRSFPARSVAARRTARLRFDAEDVPRGDYRVRITVTREGERTVTSTLTARRL